MEKKPRSARLSWPGRERALELVGQRVLAVVVAADRGGLPPHRPCLQQRDQPQLRVLPALGDAELGRQLRAVEQVQGGAVEDDQLQAERGPARRQRDVVPRGVELEGPPHRLLAQPGRACENAGPVGTGVPGRTRVPGIENALARTMS